MLEINNVYLGDCLDLMKKIYNKYQNLKWALFRFLMFNCKLCFTPFKFLFSSIDGLGVQFWYEGDEVIYVWPWLRKKYKSKYYSISFCGGGFNTLKEIKDLWQEYENACKNITPNTEEI